MTVMNNLGLDNRKVIKACITSVKNNIPLLYLTMINFKKMDDKDLVFINRPLTEKEDLEFSEYLKAHKKKIKVRVKRQASTVNILIP
ncbi:MAG: hypothetical protein COW65_06630 [Cytophagales bacterium CG18_big_fil_WC_8_21_14_2_50_42_9]|nr:MAG: hypothetical protein COW65_06630 [Cytophagales bacterium CG18_big_fil_WC_8_21_14_2_50_42_9]